LRRDRLHDLDSLFLFADDGDRLRASEARNLSLEIVGPFAGSLAREPVERNLVWRAAELLRREAGVSDGARIVLDKRLPIASGIGGGSADAAAALRALIRLWRVSIDSRRLARLAFSLGADVPACLHRLPVHVTGAGDRMGPGPALPPLWVCLVNPNVPMPTGPVFRAFDRANPTPRAPTAPSIGGACYAEVANILKNSRNDLEPIAIRRNNVIQTVIAGLARRPGALGARMSGSGATVFGLFTSAEAAARAARDAAGKGWWSMGAGIETGLPVTARGK
jgi:4-diphosphocytidyl-2-C-methyl-D-erythritol kinase